MIESIDDLAGLEDMWKWINERGFIWLLINLFILWKFVPVVGDVVAILVGILLLVPSRFFEARVSAGDSMRPSIPRGTVISFRVPRDGSEVSVGDVISYQIDHIQGPIGHRIIHESDDGFVTQGDGMGIPDLWTVTEDMVSGEIVSIGYQPIYLPLSPTAYVGFIKHLVCHIIGKRPAKNRATSLIED